MTRMTPEVRAIYERLLSAARSVGPFREDPNQSSIHLRCGTVFAGVTPRKDALILTIKSETDIRSRRIFKRQQASAHRWHLEIRLDDPTQVDRQLKSWLKDAMALSS
jgi:hypothetical protein